MSGGGDGTEVMVQRFWCWKVENSIASKEFGRLSVICHISGAL